MREVLILTVIVLFDTLTSISHGQDLPKFNARVEVAVSAEKEIRGLVISFINRELRSLGDVELVQYNPELVLSILAMEAKARNNYPLGVVLSVVILKKFNPKTLSLIVAEEYKKTASIMMSDLYYYRDHWLRVGSTDDLKDLCSEIVADFDAQYLEESRNSYRELREIWRRTTSSGGSEP